MAIDERTRAKYEPSSDIGNLIVLVDPPEIRASRMPKGMSGPFGARTERTLSATLRPGRATDQSRPFPAASRRNHTRGARPAAAGLVALCPSLRQLPILAAELDRALHRTPPARVLLWAPSGFQGRFASRQGFAPPAVLAASAAAVDFLKRQPLGPHDMEKVAHRAS
jgi:hypothetical protein